MVDVVIRCIRIHAGDNEGGPMVNGRRALFVMAATAVLLSTAGCVGVDLNEPLDAAQWATAAGSDLNCPGQATVRSGSPEYYDITGDGAAESFVDFICAGSDAVNGPDQIEVFSGASRSTRLARITSIAASPRWQVFLAHGCIYFTGNRVVVIGRMRRGADPDAAPTLVVAQISTWTDGRIHTGHPVAVKDTNDLPPGCS
jgi:hypothetical protein